MTELNAAASQAALDDALRQVETGVSENWKTDAFEAVKLVASNRAEFTSDDLWGLVEKPREPRALGPILIRACREGLIESTGRVKKTDQVTRHRGLVAIWRSRTFATEALS